MNNWAMWSLSIIGVSGEIKGVALWMTGSATFSFEDKFPITDVDPFLEFPADLFEMRYLLKA